MPVFIRNYQALQINMPSRYREKKQEKIYKYTCICKNAGVIVAKSDVTGRGYKVPRVMLDSRILRQLDMLQTTLNCFRLVVARTTIVLSLCFISHRNILLNKHFLIFSNF